MKANCPNCGAPVNSDYVRCQYCGTPYEVDLDDEITFVDIPERVNGILPLTTDIVLTPDEIQRRLARQRSYIYYDRCIEELYSEAISAISTSRYQGEIEEKLTMVKESLDDIERKYYPVWANLIVLLVMMAPVIITALLILIE